MRLLHVDITEFEVLRDIHLDLDAAGDRLAFTGIIGPNGTGKTTLLVWILRALTGGGRNGRVVFDTGERRFDGDGTVSTIGGAPASNVLFVGSVRDPRLRLAAPLQAGEPERLPDLVARDVTQDTSSTRLHHVHQWLMHLQLQGKRPNLWTAVSVLFPSLEFVEFNPQNHDLMFNDRGTMVGFNQLSAGQRAMVTLLGEMERHCAPDGLVLWDEPEAHLHPALQWNLRAAVAEVLPRGQVIVATHSPHIVEGLAPHQVVVLGDVEGGPS